MKSVVYSLILSIIFTLVANPRFDLDWTNAAGLLRGVPLFHLDDHSFDCAPLPSVADIELHRAFARWP
jgi:hypothetical protein